MFLTILSFLFLVSSAGAAPSCSDSDGGRDYYTRGQTSDADYERTDFCEDLRSGNEAEACAGEYCILREYYCGDDGKIKESVYNCPNGCRNGACADVSQSETRESSFYVDIKYPQGGNELGAGQTYEINWSQKNVDSVSLGYKANNLNWIKSNLETRPITGNHSYKWTVPEELIGLKAFFYISYESALDGKQDVALSDGLFTVVEEETGDSGRDGENYTGDTLEVIDIANQSMYDSLKGKILLKVEDDGRAYYVHPRERKMYYLGRPADAFRIMREQGAGITTNNISKIRPSLSNTSGSDADGDGLGHMFEEALGTDPNNPDSDGDGFSDKGEVENGYNPLRGSGAKLNLDQGFAESNLGRIFLQVEQNGEAWYVYPEDASRYFLGRPVDAFAIMRSLGLGISNQDFERMK